MRGFKVDERGDIVIENGKIALIENTELKAQTLRTVMGTNKGEWFLNNEEGINFDFLIGKGITDDMRRSQCEDACKQVDGSLYVSNFRSEVNKQTRESTLYFEAKGDGGVVIDINQSYGGNIEETNADASSKLALANAQMATDRAATVRLERRLSGQ